MTQIDTRDRLAAVIRRQVSSLATPAASSGSGRAAAAPSPNAQRREATDGSNDVAALVSRRVRAIDPDDPNRHRKAFRVFLESVLLAELGKTSSTTPASTNWSTMCTHKWTPTPIWRALFAVLPSSC